MLGPPVPSVENWYELVKLEAGDIREQLLQPSGERIRTSELGFWLQKWKGIAYNLRPAVFIDKILLPVL